MTGRSHRVLRAGFYLASALIGVLSVAPGGALPPSTIGDKAEHVIAYAALALLGVASSRHGILRTILGLAAFGIALEFLQTFSPGRSPEFLDALADIVGACIGGGAALALRRVTSTTIDMIAGATRSRACVAGRDDALPAACGPAAAPSSQSKRASCVSN